MQMRLPIDQKGASGQPVSRSGLLTIIEQLKCLIDLETGARRNSAALTRMTIGVLTAREIDDAGYKDLAQVLHFVCGVDALSWGRGPLPFCLVQA